LTRSRGPATIGAAAFRYWAEEAAVSQEAAAVGDKGLKGGALGFLSSIVIGVSSTAPGYSLASALGFVTLAVGFQAPAIMLVAFVPMLFIAAAYYYLNRADPDCGTTFAWVTRAMGPHWGWMGGWGILAADIIVMANLSQIAGLYTFELFGATSYANSTFWVTVVGVAWIVVMTWICYVGIEVSAKVQWGLLGAEIVILGVFAVVALARVYGGGVKGSVRPSLSWINPFAISSWGALSAGLLTAIFIYWGWDSTVSVNEETEDSSQTPGKAAIVSTFILVGIYLIDTIAAQAYHGAGFLTANSNDVFSALSRDVLGSPLDKLVILAVLTSASASTQTTILPTARTSLSMATHKAIPSMFARIHPRYLTPSVSTLWMGGLSIIWYVTMTRISPNVLGASIAALGLMIAFYYGLTGIACPIYYRRQLTTSVKNFVMICIAPLVGAAILFFAFFKSAYDFYSDTSYGSLLGIGETFVIGIGFLLLGVVLMLISVPIFRDFFRRKPEVVDPHVAVHGAGSEPGAAA
jgi:amino acid transporter